MDDTTILGGALNQLGQTVKQTAQQAVKLPGEMAKSAADQIIKPATPENPEEQSKPAASADGSGEPKQWQSDQERVDFLKKLYGSEEQNSSNEKSKTNQTSANPLVSAKEDKPSEFQEQIKDKTPEEQKELIELRDKLHKENYYDPTFNPVKNPPAGGEERPAEKVENEKKQEMQDLQQKDAKKPPPLAVVREQNKAEVFRGAAG